VCDLETSRMAAPYIYDISRLRVKMDSSVWDFNVDDGFTQYKMGNPK